MRVLTMTPTDRRTNSTLRRHGMRLTTLLSLAATLALTFCIVLQAPGTAHATASIAPTVTYRSHVQDHGWLAKVSNGQTSGTTGKSKQLEDLQIWVKGAPGGSIKYRMHVKNRGWMPYVRSGASAGTTGQGLQAEAVQILLTGNLAKQYDVIYRVHVASKGWLPFTKNNGVAGSTGIGLRIEAIQIKLVKKNSTESRKVTGAGARLSKPKFTATAHVQDLAWLNPVGEGAIIGTTKQGKNLEGLKLMMPDIDGKGNVIMARAHVSDEG